MTNKDKLTAWDADFYSSLSDDVCFICLSQKQIYVLGQALRQVSWSTRWHGDISAIDLDYLSGELEAKLSDMTSCEDIQRILDLVIGIRNDVDDIQVQIDNIINETNWSFPNGATGDTSVTDVIPNSDLIAPIGGYTSGCSSDADRDALYGGCVVLADYMVQKIGDLLELLDATVGQVSENLEKIVGAIPFFETLPADEVLGFVEWINDHALEVWDATVTDERKQDLACLFYCYAASYGDCSLSLYDCIDLLSSTLPSGLNLLGASIRDAVGIIAVGTPIGNDMFYGMLALELIVVAQGQTWLDVNGFNPYEYRFLSGTNSPDNDWSIFCVSCPVYYRVIDTDFTDTLGEWLIEVGDLQSNGVAGIDVGDNQRSVVTLTTEQDMQIEAIQYISTRSGSTLHGMRDLSLIRVYEENLSESPIYEEFDGFQPDGVDIVKCEVGASVTGKAIRLFATVTDSVSSLIVIHSVKIWISAGAKIGTLTIDAPPC